MVKPLLTSMSPLPDMMVHQYERYLPSAFDESLTIVQKMNKIIEHMNQLGLLTNEMIDKWNEVMDWVMSDGLKESVEEKLEEWYQQGYFNDLIGQFVGFFGHHVDWYGAKGDGITDDSDAIQSALDLGGAVYFRMGGTYMIHKNLKIKANTTIYAVGSTLKRGAQTMDYMFMNGDYGQSFTGYNGNGNISVIGGTYDCDVDHIPYVSSAFALNHGNNILFDGCVIKNIGNGHGLDLNGCKNVRVKNCRFLGYRDLTPTQTRNYAEAIQISNSVEGSFPYVGAFDGTPCKDIFVENCYTGNSDALTTVAWGCSVGAHGAFDNRQSNVNIKDCYFEGGDYYAVRALLFDGLRVDNCIVKDFVGFVFCNQVDNFNNTYPANVTDNVFITGCYFEQKLNSSYNAVRVWGSQNQDGTIFKYVKNFNFTNNRLISKDKSKAYMELYGVDGCEIKGNKATGFKTGIISRNNLNVNIKGETIMDILDRGIHFYVLNDNFTVEDCTLENISTQSTAVEGIVITGATNNGILKNNIVRKGINGNMSWGVYVNSTCLNVNGISNFADQGVFVSSAAGREGAILNDNAGKRYLLRVNAGVIELNEWV